jgi:gluconolactonase
MALVLVSIFIASQSAYLAVSMQEAPKAETLFRCFDFTSAGSFTAGIEGPAVDREGNVYAVNFKVEGTIGKVSADGVASVFVTLPKGSIGNGIRFDRQGAMYVADYTGHNILRIDMSTFQVSVFAHEPRMNQPNDLAIGENDILYASDAN